MQHDEEETIQGSGESPQSNIGDSSSLKPNSKEEEEETRKKKPEASKPPIVETYKRKAMMKGKRKPPIRLEEEEQEDESKGKKLSLQNNINDIENNRNYNTIKDRFPKFNKPNRSKIVHIVLVSLRVFNKMLAILESQDLEELYEIIKENLSKAIREGCDG